MIKNYKAEAAIEAFRIVKFGAADGQVVKGAANTDPLIGVSTDIDAAINERVDVIHDGTAHVRLGGAVTRGDMLMSDAAGKAVVAVRHTHVENTAAAYVQNAVTQAGNNVRVIGYALQSGVLDDVILVKVQPSFG